MKVFSFFGRRFPVVLSLVLLLHQAVEARVSDQCQQTECTDAFDYDVIIVGAGMSGLAAANKLLTETDYSVKVIEAQERVGGRMKSQMFGGELVELGANFISGGRANSRKHPIKNLADDMATPIPYYQINMENIDFYDAMRPENKRKLKDRDWKPRFRDLRKTHNRKEDAADELYVDYYDDLIVDVDDRAVRQVLANEGPSNKRWTPRTSVDRALEVWFFRFFYLFGPDKLSLHNFPEDTFSDFGHVENFVNGANLTNGIEALAKQFRLTFDPDQQIVHTGEPVTSIDYNECSAQVTTSVGVYTAKKVILATGIEALKELNSGIKPPIASIDDFPVELGIQTKVYLKFDEAVWDTSKQVIMIGTEGINPMNSLGVCNMIINYDFHELKPGSRMLGCFVDQDTLDSYYGTEGYILTEAVAQDPQGPILKPLKNAFPSLSAPSNVLVTNWAEEPYVKGSWEVWGIESDKDLSVYYDFIDQPLPGRGTERTLILAGCHTCARYFGFMHGAYYAGVKAAKYAIQSLEATDTSEERPYSPCDETQGTINGDE